MPERLECEVLQKVTYILLPFTFVAPSGASVIAHSSAFSSVIRCLRLLPAVSQTCCTTSL